MKPAFGMSLILASAFAIGCAVRNDDFYEFKVIGIHDDFYAEWGERDGEHFEDRYDAIECAISRNGSRIDTIDIYRHWFKMGRNDAIKVGDVIRTEIFDYKVRTLGAGDGYTIELDEFMRHRKKS